jgi:hypothetical protein
MQLPRGLFVKKMDPVIFEMPQGTIVLIVPDRTAFFQNGERASVHL